MNINFLQKQEPTAQAAAASFQSEDLVFFRYIRILVYILVFLVPLFFLPWTSEVLDFNKQILIFALSGAGLILYLGQVVRTGRLIVRKTPLNYAVLVFLAAVVVVSIFSDFKYQSIFGGFGSGFYQSLVTAASFAVFFFIALNVFGLSGSSARQDAVRLLGVFGLSLSLALLLGALQILGAPVFKIFGIAGSAFNTIGTVNSMGVAAALLLVLSLSKIDFEQKIFGYVRLPALILSLFFFLLLNWWVLWVVAISGLVFVMVSSSMSDWRISNYFWPSTLIFVAVVAMLLNLNLAGPLSADLPLEIAPSFSASADITRRAIVDDPLFGVGPENFRLAHDSYKPQSINNTIFWNIRFSEATSEVFNSAVALGVVGLAGFLFLLWKAVRVGLKNYELFSLFAVIIGAWVLYPFNLTLGFAFWLLLVVLALSASRDEDEVVINLEKSPRHSLITSVSFIGVMVLVVVGFYFMGLRYAANIKFAAALTESDIDKQTQNLVDAINLNRSEDLYSRNLANLLVARVNQEFQKLSGAKTDAERQEIVARVQNFSTTAINLANETTERHGRDATNWFSRALVYESLINVIDGADQWAARIYQEYSRLAPNDPTPHLRTGSIYLNRADSLRRLISGAGAQNIGAQDRANLQNQISENLRLSEESFMRAIELKPNYALAIYNLGAVYEREGRVKDAVRQLEMTGSTNPLDPNVAFQLGLLYYRDNRKDQSFNELRRAVAIFPDFSNARWYLALLYEERGDLDAALAELYRIEELNPENEILLNKIEEIEEGRRSIPPQSVTGVEPLEQGSDNDQ